MFRSPFALDPKEISLLEPRDFTDLINRLLFAEAGRSGIPPTDVGVTMNINVGDGGIDARVRAPDHSSSRWMNKGLSIFQFKKGRITQAILKAEWQSERIQEALLQGAQYVWVTGHDLNDMERMPLERCLHDLFTNACLEVRYKLLNASQLCEWAAELPALLVDLGRPIGDLMGYEHWGRTALGYDIPLQDGAEQEAFREQLRLTVASGTPSVHIRVEGRPGVGKGRQVYEALSRRGLAERVLYANGPDVLHGLQLFSYLASRPHNSAILVINRCSAAELASIASHAAACTGLTLITTGGPSQPGAPGLQRAVVLAAPALATQTLQAVVRAAAPTLHPQAAAFIAYQTGDNAALGVQLARALEAAGAVTVSAAAAAQTVKGWLRPLVPLPEEQRVAEALSLLQQVGYRGGVEVEGRAIASFADIAWDEMQRVTERLQERGLVRAQGRYWTVEPPLLGVHLAATVWKRRGRTMLDLVRMLPDPITRRMFWARFADLGEDPITSDIALRLLAGPEPLCRTLDDLDEHAAMLRLFGSVAPAVVLEVLERLFASSPPVPILLPRSWHEIVWTLELLLWQPITYDGAARLLRSMAAAEAVRTTPATTARRAWRALFQTHLGGTSVSALRRHELLADTLSSTDGGERLLAVEGISASLAIWQERDGSYERGGMLLPPEWQPGSRADLLAIYTSALSLLDRALADTDVAVRRVATEVLLGASRDLFKVGLAEQALDRLERTARELHIADSSSDEERYKVRELIEVLQLGQTTLGDDCVRRLHELHTSIVGTDFGSRLRYWVGHRTVRQMTVPQEDPATLALAALAREATTRPSLLESQLAWLTSNEAFHAGEFALLLGESDGDGRWQVPLMQGARAGKGSGFLALYLLGRARHGAGFQLKALLDRWTHEDRDLAETVLEATVRDHQSDDGAQRLIGLVDRGWLPVAALSAISWGTWPASVSIAIASAVLGRLCGADDTRCAAAALFLIERRLAASPRDQETLAPLALPLLVRLRGDDDGQIMYLWNQVAIAYATTAPEMIAHAIISGLAARGTRTTGQDATRLDILVQLAGTVPVAVWRDLTPLLADPGWVRYRDLRELMGVLTALPVDLLLSWAAEDYPRRALQLARAAPIGGPQVAGLARSLLMRFGTDQSVGEALAPHRRAAAFYEEYTTFLGEHLRRAEVWATDREPLVARWARGLALSIRLEIADLDDV